MTPLFSFNVTCHAKQYYGITFSAFLPSVSLLPKETMQLSFSPFSIHLFIHEVRAAITIMLKTKALIFINIAPIAAHSKIAVLVRNRMHQNKKRDNRIADKQLFLAIS